MAFTFVTITHEFDTAGDAAAAGSVEFLPTAPMHNGTETISAVPVVSVLAGSGLLSQKLAANTNPGTQPGGITYQITEKITGQKPFTYFIQVPHDQGSTLNLRDLTEWAGGSTGETVSGVSSINGHTGTVVLAATDLGAQPLDSDLTGLAGLNDGVPVRTGATWTMNTRLTRTATAPITVTYAGTIALDASLGWLFRCTATGNLLLSDITSGVDGQEVYFEVYASGGGRVLSFAGGAASVAIPSGSLWSGAFRYRQGDDTWRFRDGFS